jgi:hypothetical protein
MNVDPNAPVLATVKHDLVLALMLEIFATFGFSVAIVASLGAFSGGSTPNTPLLAQAYFVVGIVVTIAVIVWTKRMLNAAGRRDVPALRRLDSNTWVLVAWIFSAILPGIYLSAAMVAIRNLE